MVASAETLIGAPFNRPRIDSGVSDDAERLRALFDGILVSLALSVAIGGRYKEALTHLETAFKEAAEDNWDGYGAQRAHPESVKFAHNFLFALPTTTPLPEVSVDPDGEVSFTWQRGPRLVFSVSISKDGVLSYAGLFGRNKKAHGTEDFIQTIPKTITDNLERLFSAEG